MVQVSWQNLSTYNPSLPRRGLNWKIWYTFFMKTIRLLYPDFVSGGLDEYYFGANLLSHIIPENSTQPLIKVDIIPPDGKKKEIIDGIYAKDTVISGIKDAQKKIKEESPDRIITIGGNCLVSLAPFDYLHKKGKRVGIIWIDAHPDVSSPEDGYPSAHAMVLRTLLGKGVKEFSSLMENERFKNDEILYVGLQDLHIYQKEFLDDMKEEYKIQRDEFISNDEIKCFMERFDEILLHLDIDVLSEKSFHSTYFANPMLSGDGSKGGMMTIEKLSEILQLVFDSSNVTGFTIAEYLPFDEYKLNRMFSKLNIFS